MQAIDTVLAGRYRIIDVIAEGGMGLVYRAIDDRLARPVAVKTVRNDDPQLVIRLRREARLLARLSHPNIVGIYDVVEQDDQPYLVTELVDGVPLRGLLGGLPAGEIARIGVQMADALATAHDVDIIHRDLKPANVLVGPEGARLLDFGIARQVDDTTLTSAEEMLGTASYLSPEQLHGRPAGPPSDVYALGLVLIECFSGCSAFPGTFAETMAVRLIGRPELPDAMPAAWYPMLRAITAPDPERRPTAAAVAVALGQLADEPEQPVTMPIAPVVVPRRPTRPPRRGALLAAAAAALVLVLGGLGLLTRGGAAPTTPAVSASETQPPGSPTTSTAAAAAGQPTPVTSPAAAPGGRNQPTGAPSTTGPAPDTTAPSATAPDGEPGKGSGKGPSSGPGPDATVAKPAGPGPPTAPTTVASPTPTPTTTGAGAPATTEAAPPSTPAAVKLEVGGTQSISVPLDVVSPLLPPAAS